MTGRSRGRLVAGVAGLLLSAGYAAEMRRTLSFGTPAQPGAAVFPAIAAALMAVASLALVAEQLRRPSRGPELGLDLPRGSALARLVLAAGGLAAYVVVATTVGHLVGSLVLCLVLVCVLEPGSFTRVVVTALAIAVAIQLVFVTLLGVPLPVGRLFER